jgi:indolepyruvate ferredoxin oxidoreductase alpha subunit
LIEAGCHVITSYPGTPSSEILPASVRFKKELGLRTHIEWSTNEKVAFDQALAASMTGKRAAVVMKQVGLNVAADSLMSSAYTGVIGGFVIISCDDPGPHSSQTEQDSRFFAMFAKVPALDPCSPAEARDMVQYAFTLSEKFQIPVIVRPAIRVCHAKQSIILHSPVELDRKARFTRDPKRWAATPRFRLTLHRQLNAALEGIGNTFETENTFNRRITWTGQRDSKGAEKTATGIISAGVPHATLMDILRELDPAQPLDILKIGTVFPLPETLVTEFIDDHDRVLVIEETDSVIEMQLPVRGKLMGRRSGHIPREGELTPDVMVSVLSSALDMSSNGVRDRRRAMEELEGIRAELHLPVRRPSLCAGCPERAAFFAIRRALPKAIYTSDIGCYTLGLNLDAVDTVLDMGAGITIASGLYHAFDQDGIDAPIVATVGDSTFYHSGPAGLLNAVYNRARFILVILDNETTAMTGMQPTPGTGITADGTKGASVPLERIVKGCGIDWIRVVDPYDVGGLVSLLKEARQYTIKDNGGIAVIIARHPCLINDPGSVGEWYVTVEITAECNGCGYCLESFECPALHMNAESTRVDIDRRLCVNCGVCVNVCPRGAIVQKNSQE